MSAPRKVPDGFDVVLFVRATRELLEQLDAVLARERRRRRCPGLSRSDLVREVLCDWLKQQGAR